MERDVSWEGFELRFLKVHSELETNRGKKGREWGLSEPQSIFVLPDELSIYSCFFQLFMKRFRCRASNVGHWMIYIRFGKILSQPGDSPPFPSERTKLDVPFDRSLRVITLFTPLVKVPEINRSSFAPCHKLASIPCFSVASLEMASSIISARVFLFLFFFVFNE
jgi:hypothetical protein